MITESGDSVRMVRDAEMGHGWRGNGFLFRVRTRGEETSLGQNLYSLCESRTSMWSCNLHLFLCTKDAFSFPVQLHARVLWESLLWAQMEKRGGYSYSKWVSFSLCYYKIDIFFQVEEEATDKDNKNCSKDGMCGKVRLCLPPYWVVDINVHL